MCRVTHAASPVSAPHLVKVASHSVVLIQGRGSSWQDSLTLSASGTPLGSSKASAAAAATGASGAGGGGAGAGNGGPGGGRGKSGDRLMVLSGLMEPPEVARVFEERLAEALLGRWSQLAFSLSALHLFLGYNGLVR